MKIRNLFRPVYLVRRLALMAYERRHPDHPWIAAGAIDFCAAHLHQQMEALEWGSGRSTLWWARHVKHLVSVEQDEMWHSIISQKLSDQAIANVDYRFVQVDPNITGGPRQVFDVLPPYVAVIEQFPPQSLDFVVVDGHYRVACIRAAIPRLKAGGLLLIDNFNWLPPEKWEIPDGWVKVCDSSNALTQTVIWKKPAMTESR